MVVLILIEDLIFLYEIPLVTNIYNILNKIRIFIAPESLRKEYEFKHKSIQKEIGILEIQNQNLIKQRDLLLPRLMNGTIEVK